MATATPFLPEHSAMASALVQAMEANHGLAPVDIDQFWQDQAIAAEDPFGNTIPQVAIGGLIEYPCIFDELELEEDHWRYEQDEPWRLEMHKRFNDKAEKIVGIRPFTETPVEPALQYPPVKGLHDIFESQRIWKDQSWWLLESAHSEEELIKLLARVNKRIDSLRDFLLPPEWDEVKPRLMEAGIKPSLYRGQRGPVTFATSVYGIEPLIYLIMDNPALATEFSQTILRAMLEMGRILDEEAGYTSETAPHGFGFADDNCYLLTPDMYELFAYPILCGMFERYCPHLEDKRFQHSDSAMTHLLPILAAAGLNGTNFGPTVRVDEIRRHMPNAVIRGQLAPFTYSRNQHEQIVLEFLRDMEMTRESRGLVFTTAGSVNNGTRLTSMRLIMAAVQRYGRF